ncbi:hypothetical protein BDZ89DRAFT_1077372 [Hymenopellis radicata]|nr:hypothetical protein BDZ89DRAFT_1077372 [Hymenopellis radicata]
MPSPLRVTFVDEQLSRSVDRANEAPAALTFSSVNQAGLSEWLVFFTLGGDDVDRAEDDDGLTDYYAYESSKPGSVVGSADSESEGDEELPDLCDEESSLSDDEDYETLSLHWTSDEEDEPEVWDEHQDCLEYLPFVFPMEF